MSRKKIIQFYNDFSETYDEVVLRDKDYIAFEKIPYWMIPHLKKEDPVLDLGCGTGLSSRCFFEHGLAVTGIDITPNMVEKCQKLPYKNLLCQSLEDPLPFANAEFTAAILLGVMEFIHRPSDLFAEVARVLKSPGWFGLTVPKKIPQELEDKLGILTYHPLEIEKLFSLHFSLHQKEEFQGFNYASETVQYCGYLFKKKQKASH